MHKFCEHALSTAGPDTAYDHDMTGSVSIPDSGRARVLALSASKFCLASHQLELPSKMNGTAVADPHRQDYHLAASVVGSSSVLVLLSVARRTMMT